MFNNWQKLVAKLGFCTLEWCDSFVPYVFHVSVDGRCRHTKKHYDAIVVSSPDGFGRVHLVLNFRGARSSVPCRSNTPRAQQCFVSYGWWLGYVWKG